MARSGSGGQGRFIGDDDYKSSFKEELEKTLDLETWSIGLDIERLIDDIRGQVSHSSTAEEDIQATVRAGILGNLKEYTRLDVAGVYQASEERLRTVFEALLFPGRVEAVSSIVASHDSLPLGITQLGVAVVGYGGMSGTFSQRLFRKELSTEDEDPIRAAMECMGARHERSGTGRRDMVSALARRGLRDYAERAILLDKSQAEWRIGQGNPCSQGLLTGSGYPRLLMASLKMLSRLIGGHKKFVFVPHAMEERGYLTLGHALRPGEYAIIKTLESDSAHAMEGWSYPNEEYRGAALSFVRKYCGDILIGLFRASEHAPPSLFFAHREHVHVAAHIVMADSLIHPRRGFPMLLEVADSSCRGVFGTDSFQGLVQDAFTRAGGKYQYINERRWQRQER
ncbi:hypothetical protein [Hyalangium versicolor]|uniref:hypothetical protein n=1 Tax=Hyalangium versicolor TaxID=2861190 RepID=UPI001CCE5C33|nr:hypothetical protein [Hyalangium versicolor]